MCRLYDGREVKVNFKLLWKWPVMARGSGGRACGSMVGSKRGLSNVRNTREGGGGGGGSSKKGEEVEDGNEWTVWQNGSQLYFALSVRGNKLAE